MEKEFDILPVAGNDALAKWIEINVRNEEWIGIDLKGPENK